MEIVINNHVYYTNITDNNILEKCKKFFSDGCTSYAISFYNFSKDVIMQTTIDNMPCNLLRGFNFNYRFVPKKAEKKQTAKELLESGLDLIELL